MNKDICIKEGVYRYENENSLVFFDKEKGLLINTKGDNYIESLYSIYESITEILQLENE